MMVHDAADPTHPPVLLVVDDDDTVRRLVASSFRRRGWDVWLAGSGAEAVALLRERPGRTAVVLIEGPLPGLKEPDAVRKLDEWLPGVRWCFLRGYGAGPATHGGAVIYARAAELDNLLGDAGADSEAAPEHSQDWPAISRAG